jgi:hypothetical protein
MQDMPKANESLEDSELNDEELDGVDGGLNKKSLNLDSKSDMGETESFRLQMAMDRVSKFQATLSNVMQKSSQTSGTITQHMK